MSSIPIFGRSLPGQKPRLGVQSARRGRLIPDIAYVMNEGSGSRVADLVSGIANTGFTGDTGTPTWTPSQEGVCLNFITANTQYVTLPTQFLLCNGDQPFTVIARLRTTSTTTNLYAYTEGNSGATQQLVGLGLDNVTPGVGVLFVRPNTPINRILLHGTILINDGKWHTVAGVYDRDGQTGSLYVDGHLDTSGPTTTGSTLTLDKCTIGALGRNSYGNGWPGDIGWILCYRRPLSAVEVASISIDPFQWIAPRRYYAVTSGTNDVIYPGRNARCGRSIISHW